MNTLNISYSSLTNIGGRSINEDYLDISVRPQQIAFILCDGLGGHGNGDVASKLVVCKMKEALEQSKSMEESIMQAQNALMQRQREVHMEDSMKTTVTCLTIFGQEAKFGHVGDSRIYYFEKAKFKMRSQDHSIPQMLVNRGDIKEKDIRHHEDRNRLLRVMGTMWDSPKYQIVDKISLTRHSSFLLCSDGFWEMIDEKSMCKTLKKTSSPEQWLKDMELIVRKNGSGTNMDNYSAIAVFIR
ncbi:MAG: serine/threonine-protein phosphatase [Lachnospiraceae bacterium]|nr:serine/threonine-protein phosphatase [Lachnospiraceae bacterium]